MVETQKQQKTFAKGCAGGVAAAVADGITYGAILTALKVDLQVSQFRGQSCMPKFHGCHDVIRYGLARLNPYLCTMVPATALQFGINNLFSTEESSRKLQYFAAGAGGAIGGVAATWVENIFVLSAAHYKNPVRYVWKNRIMFNGLPLTIGRDVVYSVMMQHGARRCHDWVVEQTGSESLGTVGYIGAGIGTALVTHPFDVLGNKIRYQFSNQPTAKINYAVIKGAASKLHTKSGWLGFFIGVVPRTLTITAGIPFMSHVSNEVQKYLGLRKL